MLASSALCWIFKRKTRKNGRFCILVVLIRISNIKFNLQLEINIDDGFSFVMENDQQMFSQNLEIFERIENEFVSNRKQTN